MSAISIANQQNISLTGKTGNQSIFIWLDILGFSKAVENESEYEKLAELLEKFQSLFNEGDGYRTKIISDGIILQITNSDYESLVKILKDIGEKQFRFINENGHFIRGGISVGTKLEKGNSDSSLFISNGLARAVKIEETHVSWPVIGTNHKVLSEIRKLFQINNDKEDFKLTKGFNAYGAELYFIDFLKEENNDYYELLNKKVKDFRDKMEKELRDKKEKDLRNDSKALNKYLWLLRYYHNRFGSDNLDESLAGVVI